MILWDYLAKNSYDSLINKALTLENLATYAEEQLILLENKLKTDLWVERTPLSLTIRFKQANPDIVFKYSLSGETLYVNEEQRQYSHIFIMEHVTEELINNLIFVLSQDGAIPDQTPQPEIPQNLFVPDAKRLLHVPQTGRGFK
jgi:histidine decarboxylase